MAQVLAFDVYGTLIDTHGVVTELEQRLGALGKAELAAEFSRRWRDKQLEYSFRRGLMGAYVSFGHCTEEALVFTDRALQAGLSETDRDHLMQVYARLRPFPRLPMPCGDSTRPASPAWPFPTVLSRRWRGCSSRPASAATLKR